VPNERSANELHVAPWTCPSCGADVATPFCPGCGERPIVAADLSLKGIAAQLTKAVGGIDGRLLRTLRGLLRHPGSLTLAYAEGRRKPLVGPLQLFFLANVAFFAAQSLTHMRVFSSSLASHLHQQDWSALAQHLVADRLAVTQATLENYAPLFDRAVVLHAKSLVIAMVPPFAIALPVLFLRSRRPFSIHLAFALHFYAFVLLLFCLCLAAAAVAVLFGSVGLESPPVDNALTAFIVVASALYLYAASATVYGAHGVAGAAKAIVLAIWVVVIVVAYRFAMLLVTLYIT
jgi:hypothetical protein